MRLGSSESNAAPPLTSDIEPKSRLNSRPNFCFRHDATFALITALADVIGWLRTDCVFAFIMLDGYLWSGVVPLPSAKA